jgi:hypothetical protein
MGRIAGFMVYTKYFHYYMPSIFNDHGVYIHNFYFYILGLSFQSTATGIIGKDPGFATCAVEDLTQWDMMKITRVNKDGREEAIAAWKLGVGKEEALDIRNNRNNVCCPCFNSLTYEYCNINKFIVEINNETKMCDVTQTKLRIFDK